MESAVVADEQADRLRMAAQAANVRAGRRAWDMVLLVMGGDCGRVMGHEAVAGAWAPADKPRPL